MLRKNHPFLLLAFIYFIMSTSTSYAEDTTALDLIHIQGCKGCHRMNAQGGTSGPALDGIGKRLTYEQIKQKILNPKKNKSTSTMPDYRHLTPIELDQLIDYLAHLR